MDKRLIFIFDGECPFCNHFAQLLELKANIPNLKIKDARSNPSEIPKEYDMDIQGAILYADGVILSGDKAINLICSKINNPSAILLNILRITFSSSKRSKFVFPFLLRARRVALSFKGVQAKL